MSWRRGLKLWVLLWALGCNRGGVTEAETTSRPLPSQQGEALGSPRAEAPIGEQGEPMDQAPALPTISGRQQLPINFPAVFIEPGARGWVLAPPEPWLLQLSERGAERQALDFFAAELVGVGSELSMVKIAEGQRWTVPNSLVVSLPKLASGEPGALALSFDEGTRRWSRAKLIVGGTLASPLAYLLDSPGVGEEQARRLQPGAFRVVLEPGDPGSSAACLDSGAWLHYRVLRASDTLVLGVNYAGRLASISKENCRMLSPQGAWREGDEVMAPRAGVYQAVKLLALGGVEPSAKHAQEPKEQVLGVGGLIPGLAWVSRPGVGRSEPWKVSISDLAPADLNQPKP